MLLAALAAVSYVDRGILKLDNTCAARAPAAQPPTARPPKGTVVAPPVLLSDVILCGGIEVRGGSLVLDRVRFRGVDDVGVEAAAQPAARQPLEAESWLADARDHGCAHGSS